MMELLSIPFIQNAIIGGVILGVLLSVLSLFINMKKWSFVSVGISHATFGGLALGYYLSINPTVVGLIFAVITGLLIGYISKHGNLHEDVSIGILFSLSMAIGVILITKNPNYNNDLFTFLFGNILTITKSDISMLAVFSILALAFIYKFFSKIMFCCFDEEVAFTSGINTSFYYYLMITIISVATVLSVKLVGVILASALMILPTAFASQFVWHYKKVIVVGAITTVLVILLGIYFSYLFDMPTGAFIVVLYSVLFLAAVLIKKLRSA